MYTGEYTADRLCTMMQSNQEKPRPTYLEDLQAGMVCRIGSERFDEDSIIAFATRFDPQAMHTDSDSDEAKAVGGLIASGWHTASVAMRMLAEAPVFGITPILGIGVDELRWKVPVRPADFVTGSAEILDVRRSASKADRGVVTMSVTLWNSSGETVLSMKPMLVVKRNTVASTDTV